MKPSHLISAALIALFLTATAPLNAQEPRRITILYDAFGPPSALVKDWGFAALVEYGGKRVLFDTGNDAKIFEHNSEPAARIDTATTASSRLKPPRRRNRNA